MRHRTGRLTEGAVVDVKAKDFVSWSSSSGTAKGRVKSVHKGKVPAVPVKVVGNDVEPAARVEMYAKSGDGWAPTGRYLGLSSGELSKIDALPEPKATTEAVVSGSFDEIRRLVQDAIEDRLEQAAADMGAPGGVYIYVQDIGPDWAVYCSGYDDDQFKVTYSIDASSVVTLGDAVEVQAQTTYVAVADDAPVSSTEAVRKEKVTIAGHVVESKGADDAGGRIFGVRIIANGDSKNARRYPAGVLQEAVSLYEGARAYDHHRTDAELKTSTINGLVGSYRDVEAKADGIYGDLHLLPSATHTAEALDASLAAQEAGLPGLVGISHDVMATYRPILDGGRRLQEATQILSVNSADVVADPAAGGRATRMVAGGIDTKEIPMTLEELLELAASATPEQLAAAGLGVATAAPAAVPPAGTTEAVKYDRGSAMGKMLIRSTLTESGLTDPRVSEAVLQRIPEHFTEAELNDQVGSFRGLLGAFEKDGLIPTVPSVEVTKESHDKKVAALNATFGMREVEGKWVIDDRITGYKSFKEAFYDVTGARQGRLDTEDMNRQILKESCAGGAGFDSSATRSTESVVSGTWNTILGDAVTRRMVAEYEQPSLQTWRSIVSSIVPITDFRTQRIERLGGYGVLPGVNQGAPYQPLTTPGNEEATYAISKRGGTEDLTLETIANDDLRAITRIPIKLGLAAAQTLFRFVWDNLATNPVMSYDSTALFAAGHNNLDAGNVLSQSNLSFGRKRMRKQTAFGDSTDVLSIVPKFLIVPSDLEELAFQLCTSAVAIPATPAGPTNTPNIHQGLSPIVLDYFSATSTWFLIADPSMVPTFELGFYQGKQDPDLLVQSDATVGSVFTSDKITYKIRHIYSGTPLDHRAFYRGN
jgi:hypothetical protein